MRNLYARLVKKEDARTEALADLLERILAHDRETGSSRWFAYFVDQVLLTHATGVPEREGIVRWLNEPSAALSVETQYPIDDGTVPDMVIFDGNDPICVVEVKIDAPISEGQLEGYGRWLAEEAGGRYKPALVLLTAGIPAPSGFTDPAYKAFGVGLRGVASWNTVAEWFAEFGRMGDGVNEPLKSLAKEFGEFLKEDAMPTLDDVAIARQYLAGSKQRLKRAVESMHAGFPCPEGWSRGQLLTKWFGFSREFSPQTDEDRAITFGLNFKSVDKGAYLYRYTRYNQSVGDPEVIGDGFYAFVSISAPREECRHVPGFTKDHWWYERRQGGNFVKADNGPMVDSRGWWRWFDEEHDYAWYARISPLQDLLDDDGRLDRKLRSWTDDAWKEAKALWNALSLGGGWEE